MKNLFKVTIWLLISFSQVGLAQKPSQALYTWKNVQIVGGGFVDGIIFHPSEKGLRYCRTDMGGAYRWEPGQNRWIPLLDWLSYEDTNLMGVESIALDPSNPDRLYMACGTYTNPSTPNGAILISDDRGKTFRRINVPFKFGGNENGRGNGERKAVDPNNGNNLYLGTRHDGLWKSGDRGTTWSKVENFPDISEGELPDRNDPQYWRKMGERGSGVVFVVFDPKSGKAKKGSNNLYIGVSLMGKNNLFRTTDGGKTWEAIPGQPVQYRLNHAVLASDGVLYLSYGTNPGPARMTDGGVWKFYTRTGEWTDITPEKPGQNKPFGYAAISVDARNPEVLIASSFGRPGGEEIFRSLDGGKTWKGVFATGKKFDYTLAPYVEHTPIHWLFDIEIDPFDSNHAMFTTGYGGHETFDLTDADKGNPTTWGIMSTGIEETVALELLSPPKGAQVITAIGDYCGFVHNDLDKPVPEGCFLNPHFGNTNGIACAEKNPDMVVRVGVSSGHIKGTNIGYSLDGGKTWQPASLPESGSKLGHIAVSADGSSWIWTPDRSVPYVTFDKGNTWNKVVLTGSSDNMPVNIRVIADRANPAKFYALDLFNGKIYSSTNGGTSFETRDLKLPGDLPRPGNRGDSRGGQDRIYATPGFENDLWIAAFDGLYRSNQKCSEYLRLPKVQEIHAFGFGMAKPGTDYPAIYLIGVVDGVRGIFRSDDVAKTWTRINDDQHQWGLVLHITGDPKKYGRVYVGTHGRGTFYGDPVQ